MHHLPNEDRLQRLVRHSLQRHRLKADLITAFKILTGLLHIDPNLFSLPLARSGLRGHPSKVFQGASQRRRRESAFSMRVVKCCNKLPASVVTAPSVNVFKKRLENVWTEVFTHLPICFCKRWAVLQLVPLCCDRSTISVNVYSVVHLTACLFLTSKFSSIPNTFYLRAAELIIVLPWEHFCAANTSQTTFHLFPEWQEGFYCLRDA